MVIKLSFLRRFMFCNFEEGLPGIYRLWGKAHAYEMGTPEFDSWFKKAFTEQEEFLNDSGLIKAMRSIIVADIYEVRFWGLGV
jgi:hypothetical protein